AFRQECFVDGRCSRACEAGDLLRGHAAHVRQSYRRNPCLRCGLCWVCNMTVDTSDIERDPLEALAADFTERCRRGEQPSIESYAAEHPDLAGDIRSLFSTIRDVEQAKEACGTRRGEPVIDRQD